MEIVRCSGNGQAKKKPKKRKGLLKRVVDLGRMGEQGEYLPTFYHFLILYQEKEGGYIGSDLRFTLAIIILLFLFFKDSIMMTNEGKIRDSKQGRGRGSFKGLGKKA
ncbi:MAG: hypothetical protein ACYTE8_02955 [Planctomycetota bacterium]